MDIKYKLYPYPVLAEGADDFVSSSFTFETAVSRGIREIKFSFTMKLKNEEILAMLEQGDAEYLIHIECPVTGCRNIVKSHTSFFTKSISEKDLNGKVSVCAFIVAKKDLPAYINKDFNTNYEGITFFVDRGGILAIGGQYHLSVLKDTEELARIPSVFTICKYAANADESMRIDMEQEKIAISLSDQSFQNYKLLSGNPILFPVLHAMIIIPALIYVFETMRNDGTEDYEDYRWFAAIAKTLKKYGLALDETTLNHMDSYDLAQKLLDVPIDKALSAIAALDDGGEDTE